MPAIFSYDRDYICQSHLMGTKYTCNGKVIHGRHIWSPSDRLQAYMVSIVIEIAGIFVPLLTEIACILSP